LRSFTIASSPTEEAFILIRTRIRDTPFKKKLSSLDIGTSANMTAPLGNLFYMKIIQKLQHSYQEAYVSLHSEA
jgi:hypothetical protein